MIFHKKFKLAITRSDISSHYGQFAPKGEELGILMDEIEQLVKNGKLKNEKHEILNWVWYCVIR